MRLGRKRETSPIRFLGSFPWFSRGPVSLLALSSGSRLGRGQQSVMGHNRWLCHVTLVR